MVGILSLVKNAELEIDLIHYSCTRLILIIFLCALGLAPQYFSFANGAGGVGVFLLSRVLTKFDKSTA